MVDRYAPKRRRVARVLKRWKTGTVTLTRKSRAASDPTEAWVPGAPTLDIYDLDARVDGASAEYVDGTTILGTDLMVIASPQARHTQSDGAPADGAVVDIVPRMTDVLTIGGVEKVIKKVHAVPASGPAAMFRIFVAS